MFEGPQGSLFDVLRVNIEYFRTVYIAVRPVWGVLKIGRFGPKNSKIDIFPKNAPNHPDFAPRKFGDAQSTTWGPNRPKKRKKLYITPL